MTRPINPADLSAARPASAADTPAAIPGADTEAAASDIAFAPVPLQRRPTGWTAFRQRRFIDALAETGSVTAAADEAGASVRSAYRLRVRPDGQSFAAAWDQAQVLGARRLLDCAMERATVGAPRGVWQEGRKIGEEYVPSDRLLVFLLGHLHPTRFGKLSGVLSVRIPDAIEEAEQVLTPLTSGLANMALPADPDVHESFTTLWDEPLPTTDSEAGPEASPALTRARARKRALRARIEA